MTEEKVMIFHLSGKLRDFVPPICGDQDCRGECAVDMGYGFAGGFGIGVYEFCDTCGKYVTFQEDEE